MMKLPTRLILCLYFIASFASTQAMAQTRPDNDVELAQLIEELTNRRSDDLVPQTLADGSKMIDLKGRFQQVPLAQIIDDGQAIVACISSLPEANTFFGRDLGLGVSLSPEQSDAHTALIAEARLHGMSPVEYQFYGNLIQQGLSTPQPSTSTVSIVNNDGPGEGFNSGAAQFLPAPGNDSNANLGEQRLALFNAAAQVWGAFLDSSINIQVRAQFDSLSPCTSQGGVLGSAGTLGVHFNFPNAEFSNTLYHSALANKIAGSDLSGNPDINATFNSDIDTGCLGSGSHFYYGLDNATPSNTINLFVVLLHEMGHGLGFSTFTNGQTGAFVGGFADIWSRQMWDTTVNLSWFQMNNAQRAASAINTNNLYWDGPNVRIASDFLTAGRDPATGRVQLYTPNPFQGGSSVSHFSNVASPSLLMEPSITSGLPLNLDLSRQQMRDIGWYRDTTSDLVPDTIINVQPASGLLAEGSVQNISWTNTGGFNRNISIDLSLDGGSSFTETVATNISNTGSYSWTVPETSTTQGRIRVREHDFVVPSGQSSGNFTIQGGSAPSFTPVAALTRQQGSPSGLSETVGTVNDVDSPNGGLVVTQIAGGTSNGVSVSGVTNSGGSVSAALAAACNASSGTVRFQVSDGELTGFGDLQVNIDSNTAPALSYSNQSIGAGSDLMINPLTGPSDNGTITSIIVQNIGAFSGSISVGLTGVISITGAAPVGSHDITIRAIDNCGDSTDSIFELEVVNTPPTLTPAGPIELQQGNLPLSEILIGIADDAETPVENLVITSVAGGTATGISVTDIDNSSGSVSATFSASCTASSGTLKFEISDGNLNSNSDLQVNVLANTAPLAPGYPDQIANLHEALTIVPNLAPMDNGLIEHIDLSILPEPFAGSLLADQASGEISIGNASPLDQYVIFVEVTDNCDVSSQSEFTLEVTLDRIFNSEFE